MPTIRGAIARLQRKLTPSEYVFAGYDWEDAKARFQPRGWNTQSVLDQYQGSWEQSLKAMAEDTSPHIQATREAFERASANYRGKIRVLDWGGGLGWYLALFRSVRPDLEIDYCCYDLPILAAEGAKIWPEARFVSTVSAIEGEFDFVLASSSLQYAPDWHQDLTSCANQCRDTLFVTRCPVSDAKTHLVLQRAYGSEWLGWVLNEAELVSFVESLGLNLNYRIVTNAVPTSVSGTPPHIQCGFLFERT